MIKVTLNMGTTLKFEEFKDFVQLIWSDWSHNKSSYEYGGTGALISMAS